MPQIIVFYLDLLLQNMLLLKSALLGRVQKRMGDELLWWPADKAEFIRMWPVRALPIQNLSTQLYSHSVPLDYHRNRLDCA